MQFGHIDIAPGSLWDGKAVMELGLPKNILLALVLRGEERIVPRGDTVLCAGDTVIVVTKAYEDSDTFLMEKSVKKGGKHDGRLLNESDTEGLVLLVRRNGEDIIPDGDTVLLADDRLVILKAKE